MGCTVRLCHDDGEELDGPVDVTEPAAVKLEGDAGLSDLGDCLANSCGERRHGGSLARQKAEKDSAGVIVEFF